MSPATSTRRKHRADNSRTTVLLTAFGPFPGTPVNATMQLVPELAGQAASAFPDARFVTEMLATEWLAGPERVATVVADLGPDLILHFGVSARARGFEIEQRARNACRLMPDASGSLPLAPQIRDGGTDYIRASLPVPRLVLALRRRGIPAFASRDAGGYLCNAVLYHSLERAAEAGGTCRVGFIHVPTRLAYSPTPRGRVGACPLTWPQAVEGGLEIIAGCLGRSIVPIRANPLVAARL